MQPLRILHTECSGDLGGQELRVLLEAQGMAQRGHQIVLAVPAKSRLRDAAEKAGVPVEPLRFHNGRFPALVLEFMRILRRREVRIVNTHGSLDSWTASLAARFAPTRPILIRTRHKSTPVTNTARHRLLYKRWPHVIVTTGLTVRERFIGGLGVPPSQVVSIPTGVDTERFKPRAPSGAIRQELGIESEGPLIGSVAFLRSYKGLGYLIDAAARLRRRYPDARFVIAGDGPEQGELSRRIHRAGLAKTVTLLGFRGDIPNVLSELDVFVLPSVEGEGLPQALTQAMAMQRAIVSTPAGGIPEVLHHGITGLLARIADAESLAECIGMLLQDRLLRMRLGRAARECILKEYTLEHMLDRTELLYGRLLGIDASRLQAKSPFKISA